MPEQIWHNEVGAPDNRIIEPYRLCPNAPRYFNLKPGTWTDAPLLRQYYYNLTAGENPTRNIISSGIFIKKAEQPSSKLNDPYKQSFSRGRFIIKPENLCSQ